MLDERRSSSGSSWTDGRPFRLPDPFDKLSPRAAPNGAVFWSTLGGVLSLASAFSYWKTGDPRYLGTLLPLSVGTALVPPAVRTGYWILLRWRRHLYRFAEPGKMVLDEAESFEEWYLNHFQEFATRPLPLVAAVAFAALALLAFVLGGTLTGLSMAGIAFTLATVIFAGVAAGIGITAVFGLARLVWRIGRSVERVSVEDHKFGVTTTGRSLTKIYLVAGGVWAVFSASAVWTVPAGWLPLSLLALPAFVLILISFVYCQIPLHQKMQEEKRRRIAKLDDLRQSLAPNNAGDLDLDTHRKIRSIEQEISRIANLPDWPFQYTSLFGTAGAMLLSQAPTVLQVARESFTGSL